MSDYLFEKAGRDPEVEQLEALLSPLAYRGAAPPLPRRRPLWIPALVAAAAMVAVLVWPRSWIEGPTVLRVTDIGTVELGPDTRARMIGPETIELDHGRLSARITAPPRRFSVKTRHLTVIDLGCAFDLEVDRRGRGKLVVTEGSVAVSDGAREQVIPAGGACGLDERGAGEPSLPEPRSPPAGDPSGARRGATDAAPPSKTPGPGAIAPVEPTRVSIPGAAAPAKKAAPIKKLGTPVRPPAGKSQPLKQVKPLKSTGQRIHLEHDPLRDLENSAR